MDFSDHVKKWIAQAEEEGIHINYRYEHNIYKLVIVCIAVVTTTSVLLIKYMLPSDVYYTRMMAIVLISILIIINVYLVGRLILLSITSNHITPLWTNHEEMYKKYRYIKFCYNYSSLIKLFTTTEQYEEYVLNSIYVITQNSPPRSRLREMVVGNNEFIAFV